MATQPADRGSHPDLQSAKSKPPHFLEFTLGMRKGTSWGRSSIYRVRGLNSVQFFLIFNRFRELDPF